MAQCGHHLAGNGSGLVTRNRISTVGRTPAGPRQRRRSARFRRVSSTPCATGTRRRVATPTRTAAGRTEHRRQTGPGPGSRAVQATRVCSHTTGSVAWRAYRRPVWFGGPVHAGGDAGHGAAGRTVSRCAGEDRQSGGRPGGARSGRGTAVVAPAVCGGAVLRSGHRLVAGARRRPGRLSAATAATRWPYRVRLAPPARAVRGCGSRCERGGGAPTRSVGRSARAVSGHRLCADAQPLRAAAAIVGSRRHRGGRYPPTAPWAHVGVDRVDLGVGRLPPV